MVDVAHTRRSSARTALVLAGGGARGAYQVGVLRGLADLGLVESGQVGFDILVGSSAGAINSAALAAYADDLGTGISGLEDIWKNIRAEDVFRTDVRTIGGTGIKWAWDLTFGGAIGGVTPKSLLDTTPLRELLSSAIPFDRIESQIAAKALHALAISATDLATADGVVFVAGQPDIPMWRRTRWQIQRARIGAEHIMASSAIPILFPTVEIDSRHFGDGSVRNTAPLSPAINLGAERIFAVSVREPSSVSVRAHSSEAPSIAEIAGVLLDAVMLDAIEVDIDHSKRVNRSVVSYPGPDNGDGFRNVEVLWLQPSQNFTTIAAEFAHNIPGMVRYLMRGLGNEDATTELTSYLLFDAEYCTRLMEIGRRDVVAAEAQVKAFFAAPMDSVAESN